MTHTFLSRLFAVCTLACLLALGGCGSGTTYEPLQPHRVVAFGDASSAVISTGEAAFSVRNTVVETDSTIASRIAARYGFTLQAKTNANANSTQSISYAVNGNERIADVADQIKAFVESGYAIQEKDLFIITVGNLDIYDAVNSNETTMPDEKIDALVSAIQRLTNAGARYVLYVMPFNMSRTPWALNLNDAAKKLASQALSYDAQKNCNSFQCKFTTRLAQVFPATATGQRVLSADIQNYFNLMTGTTSTGNVATYSSYGVVNPEVPVCTGVTAGTVVLPPSVCLSTDTQTGTYNGTAYNWTNSLFADNLFLTPLGNRLIADYIYNNLMYRAGWR